MDANRPAEPAALPPGLKNAFYFATFNALSYQMILGSPMVLYAKSLEASATVLGIVAGMMPLLVIFQIPAANHVTRIGYKKFVFAGWGTRVTVIFALASVPLTGFFLTKTSQVALLLFLLFGFNLSRGISSAAWLPWITTLVPAPIRGVYLAREAGCVNIASCATLLFAAACLGKSPRPWQFAILFLFSGLNGAVSLLFLKRIPDVPPHELESKAAAAVPWGAIAAHPPFRKLLRLSVAWSLAYGGLGAFTVAYLKSAAGMSEGEVLALTGLAFLGGISGLLFFESRIDWFGSKPVVTGCLLGWIFILGGWVCLAGGVVAPRWGLVLGLQIMMGFSYALVNMNNTRMAMLHAPKMGRSHFFALYSVVSNLTLGLAPVLWGLMIDAVGVHQYRLGGFKWNRFSFYFAGVLAAFALALILCRKLEEPKARPMDELLREILIHSPQRVWVRLWSRG